MYNKASVDSLIQYIESLNGIGDKEKLTQMVQSKFCLVKDRKVFVGNGFAMRFSKAKSKRMSNTVLSLSALQKYDRAPFIVCIVTPTTNYLVLANTTFLKKISHSSQELRVDNIKGSFNGGDIMMNFENLENEPQSFEQLFAYHTGFSFEDNLERLVESTNGIVGRVQKFDVSPSAQKSIIQSVFRAQDFVNSNEYTDLKSDLDERVRKVQGEIAIASFIDNVNVRGRIIEYLITDNGSNLKTQIIRALHDNSPLPQFKTEDKLGDYSKKYPSYHTETDIKTKVLFLDGNPKAYNVDKLLEFLTIDQSVYMIYILGIDENSQIVARLCSAYDNRLLSATNIIHHWAGRNSRGVAQFLGSALVKILNDDPTNQIDETKAIDFLTNLIER